MDLIVILTAAFFAGIVNTIAGGGTFLTFPALVFIGVPPVVANATSTIAVLPGYLAGAVGYRHELKSFKRDEIIKVVGITLVGSVLGSLLLLVSSNEAFSFVVPFLLLAATLVFLFGESIRGWAGKHSRSFRSFGATGILLVSIYGGYFNGGLGIIMLALFALWGMTDIHRMNGLKTGLSFVLSVVSALIFAAGGIVEWPYALAMMVTSTLGGYAGAPIARALPKNVVRSIIALIGFSMSGIFFWRLLS